LARLERRLPTLTGGASDLPKRQQTLRSALAWSYELLSTDEQLVFRRVSAFSGGASLEAASTLCSENGAAEPELLDRLASLVDHGLLLPVQESPSGEPRLGMLETMREFGQERLELAGEWHATRRAHADYFVRLARSANSGLFGARPGEAMTRLDTEVDNLRAALTWTRDHPDLAHDLGLQLCGALGWYWLTRGHLREGRAWAEAFLEQGDWADVPLSRGLTLHTAAMLTWALRDVAAACPYAEAAVQTFRFLGQPQLLGAALVMLSRVRTYQGDADTALALIVEGRALIPNTSDDDARIRQARLGYFEGRALTAKGDLQAARACYEANLKTIRAVGTTNLGDVFTSSLGDLAVASGDDASAQELFDQALAALRAAHGTSEWDLALLLVNVGFLRLRRGDVLAASGLLDEALRHWLEQGVRAGIGVTLRGLAGVAAATSDTRLAGLLIGASTRWLVDGDPFLNEAPGVAAAVRRCLAEVRAQTDSVEFAAAWETGASLSETEALSLALHQSAQSSA
jgi:tetratricopeptide (TPR) repeat protein